MIIGPGAHGRAVRDIQQRLVALDYPIVGSELQGQYAASTEMAVRAFQQRRGLIVDGIVGTESWRELVEASWKLGDRVLYLRSPMLRGDDVRELQQCVSQLGFDPGRIDGIFGPQTGTAVRDFQANYGLQADGVVAAITVRALDGLPHLGHPSTPPVTGVRETLSDFGGKAGMRIVIDPGHGGDDTGFVGPDGLRESDCCYAVAMELEAALGAGGAQVYVTRDEDAGPSESDRAALANRLGADIFVSIHLASMRDVAAAGAATFYYGNERYQSAAGAKLADAVQSAICTLGLVDGRTHPKTWGVLRETRMAAIHIEPAFISNAREEKLLADPAFQRRLAQAVAEAIRSVANA